MIETVGVSPADWLRMVPASDSWRRTTPTELLARLAPLRQEAGITRVAELTYLDRIGLPVFQAVRPMGKALSVHQGKGADRTVAELSAVMEAIESHAAESVQPDGPVCSFDALPPDEKLPCFASYGDRDLRRPAPPRGPIRWLAARELLSGNPIYVPFDIVSLDFTFEGDTPFVRSSLGLGAGACIDDASLAALYELVERDAQAHWLAAGAFGQARSRIDPDSIGLDWFSAIAESMRSIGLGVSVYAVEGAARLAVVLCRIDEPGFAPSFLGAACRGDPDDALLRAFAEAAQSRLTVISGAREDIAADEPCRIGTRALGVPPGDAASDWRSVCDKLAATVDADALCDRLAAEGHADIARVDLAPPGGVVSVVKLVVPGLIGSPECLG